MNEDFDSLDLTLQSDPETLQPFSHHVPVHAGRLLNAREVDEMVSQERLTLRYQPGVHVKNQQVKGFEALVRGRGVSGEIIAPDRFIKVAEQSRAIFLIDEWVFAEGCRFMAKAATNLFISINASPHELVKGFTQKRIEMAEMYKISLSRIILEVTESQMIHQREEAIRELKAAQEAGFKVAIDDLFTGYSTVESLVWLPFDIVKIDRMFMKYLLSKINTPEIQKRARTIIRHTIEMAKDLGSTVIAEGVEEQEQLDIIQEYDVDFAQGYYFSPPIDETQALKLYAKRRTQTLPMNAIQGI